MESADDDLELHVSDVQTGDLYLHLEEILAPLKPHGRQDGYRLRKGEKQIGIIEAPAWAHGTKAITAEEFRSWFHEIVDSLKTDNDTIYTILVNDEPAGCLMSNMKHLKDMSMAGEILEKHLKPQWRKQKIEEYRSRLSRFFGLFSRKKAS